MKSTPAILLATLCLSAHLHAEEPVPVPVVPESHAEFAEVAGVEFHAEPAESAESGGPPFPGAEKSIRHSAFGIRPSALPSEALGRRVGFLINEFKFWTEPKTEFSFP